MGKGKWIYRLFQTKRSDFFPSLYSLTLELSSVIYAAFVLNKRAVHLKLKFFSPLSKWKTHASWCNQLKSRWFTLELTSRF